MTPNYTKGLVSYCNLLQKGQPNNASTWWSKWWLECPKHNTRVELRNQDLEKGDSTLTCLNCFQRKCLSFVLVFNNVLENGTFILISRSICQKITYILVHERNATKGTTRTTFFRVNISSKYSNCSGQLNVEGDLTEGVTIYHSQLQTVSCAHGEDLEQKMTMIWILRIS